MTRLTRLSDRDWERIRDELPVPSAAGGRPAKPHRSMVEAMLWILRTGAPWRDLPRAYGPWRSVYTRFRRWTISGVWLRILSALSTDLDDEHFIVDATILRAHQDASGGAGPRISGGHAADCPPRFTRSAMAWATR